MIHNRGVRKNVSRDGFFLLRSGLDIVTKNRDLTHVDYPGSKALDEALTEIMAAEIVTSLKDKYPDIIPPDGDKPRTYQKERIFYNGIIDELSQRAKPKALQELTQNDLGESTKKEIIHEAFKRVLYDSKSLPKLAKFINATLGPGAFQTMLKVDIYKKSE